MNTRIISLKIAAHPSSVLGTIRALGLFSGWFTEWILVSCLTTLPPTVSWSTQILTGMLWGWQQWLSSILPQEQELLWLYTYCCTERWQNEFRLPWAGKDCVCTVSRFPLNWLLINNSSPFSNSHLWQKVSVLTMSRRQWELFQLPSEDALRDPCSDTLTNQAYGCSRRQFKALPF